MPDYKCHKPPLFPYLCFNNRSIVKKVADKLATMSEFLGIALDISAKGCSMSKLFVMILLALVALFQLAQAGDVCNCQGYAGVGGPCYAGVGGPAYKGVGGPAYAGVGGACYAGVGGPAYSGVGGPAYSGVGGPAYKGVGGPAYDGVGGPAYKGVGGPCYAGVGGGYSCPAVCSQ